MNPFIEWWHDSYEAPVKISEIARKALKEKTSKQSDVDSDTATVSTTFCYNASEEQSSKKSTKSVSFRTKRKASKVTRRVVPSKVIRRRWLHILGPNRDMRRKKRDTLGGAWMFFTDRSNPDYWGFTEHDKAWFKINDLVKSEKLWKASCSTAKMRHGRRNPLVTNPQQGQINVHIPTEMYKDVEKVEEIGRLIASALESSGILVIMVYKMGCLVKGRRFKVAEADGNKCCIYNAYFDEFVWRDDMPKQSEVERKDVYEDWLRQQLDWLDIYSTDEGTFETEACKSNCVKTSKETETTEEGCAGVVKLDRAEMNSQVGLQEEESDGDKTMLKNGAQGRKKRRRKSRKTQAEPKADVTCEVTPFHIVIPSMIRDKDWISVKYHRYYKEKDLKRRKNMEGMWLIFSNMVTRDSHGYTEHDKNWFKIRELVEEGKLWRAHCSTAKRLGRVRREHGCSVTSSKGVINVCTGDYTDIAEIERTAHLIRATLDLKTKMLYKKDKTCCMLYRCSPLGRMWIVKNGRKVKPLHDSAKKVALKLVAE